MNREIKFRAWNDRDSNPDERMINPVTLLSAGKVVMPDGDEWDIPVMQSTGLNDKDGKEIYEGDILKSCYNGNHSVVFRRGAFRIEHTAECCKPWRGGLLCEVDNTDIVIGNIYQNPELLSLEAEYGKECPECGGFERNHRENCAAVE